MKNINKIQNKIMVGLVCMLVISLSTPFQNVCYGYTARDFRSVYAIGWEVKYKDADNVTQSVTRYSFKDLFDLSDPIIRCKQEGGTCPYPSTYALKLDYNYNDHGGATFPPSQFRVYVPPGTTSLEFDLGFMQTADVGIAVRYGAPLSGDYSVLNSYDSYNWTDTPTSLDFYRSGDRLLKNEGGHITVFSTGIPGGVSEAEAGWFHIKLLRFSSNSGLFVFFFSGDVNGGSGATYNSWFQANKASWGNGDPPLDDGTTPPPTSTTTTTSSGTTTTSHSTTTTTFSTTTSGTTTTTCWIYPCPGDSTTTTSGTTSTTHSTNTFPTLTTTSTTGATTTSTATSTTAPTTSTTRTPPTFPHPTSTTSTTAPVPTTTSTTTASTTEPSTTTTSTTTTSATTTTTTCWIWPCPDSTTTTAPTTTTTVPTTTTTTSTTAPTTTTTTLPDCIPSDSPQLLSPVNDAEGLTLMPQLETGAFSDPDGGSHVYTRWQVSKDQSFDNESILIDEVTGDCLTRYILPSDLVLENNTRYYWRASFYNGQCWSSPSEPFLFTTGSTGPVYENGVDEEDVIQDGESKLGEDFADENGDPINTDTIKSFKSKTDPNIQIGMIAQGATIEKCGSKDPNDLPDDPMMPGDIPFGLFSFELTVPNPGDTAQITFYFSEPIPEGFIWWMYDPNIGFYDYEASTVDQVVSISEDRMSATVKFKDGDYGDLIDEADGRIIDPSGVGGESKTAGGGGGNCFISTVNTGETRFIAGLIFMIISLLAAYTTIIVKKR